MMPNAKNIVPWLLALVPGLLLLILMVLLPMIVPPLVAIKGFVLALLVLLCVALEYDILPGLIVAIFCAIAKIPIVFLIALCLLAYLLPKMKNLIK